MKTAKELYINDPNIVFDDICLMGVYEYQPMIDEFGKIILQESDDAYQGSTWVLYQDNDRIGFLRFGWGSCSGCDALQACESFDEIQTLMDELWQSIMWFDSSKDALKFFKEHDWEGDWDNSIESSNIFVKKAIELLESMEFE